MVMVVKLWCGVMSPIQNLEHQWQAHCLLKQVWLVVMEGELKHLVQRLKLPTFIFRPLLRGR